MKKVQSNKWMLVVVLAMMLATAACVGQTAAGKEANQVNSQQAHYNVVQPIPWFDYSLERYLVIQLLKSRNGAVDTHSVVFNNFLGIITWSCSSIGYPIPGGTQLSNPVTLDARYIETSATGLWVEGAIGQAEPNGIFPAPTSAGTYVMCLNPDGTIGPVYEEDLVKAFPFPVMEVDHRLVQVPGSVSSMAIQFSPEAIAAESAADAATIPQQP